MGFLHFEVVVVKIPNVSAVMMNQIFVVIVFSLFLWVLAETPVQISCETPAGHLSHYYHFLLDCLVPSILFRLRHPKKAIELCNANLRDAHNNMQRLYRVVLPDIKIRPSCDRADKVILMDRHDDHHGSGLLRLHESDRMAIVNHFRAISPPSTKEKYVNQSLSSFQIVLIARAKEVHPNSTQLAYGDKSGGERRAISNMDELQNTLIQTFGDSAVNVVELEHLHIFEQFWLFQTASIVIGQHGAGLSNLIFTDPERLIGMMEISSYVTDRGSKNYMFFSECFHYVAAFVNAKYMRIIQHGGEFGHVNVSDVIQGVYLLNNTRNVAVAGDDVTALAKVEGVTPKSFDPTDDDALNSEGIDDEHDQETFPATKSQVQVKCEMHVHHGRAYGEEGLEFYLNCLFPVAIFAAEHPQVLSIGVCEIFTRDSPYMEVHLRNVLGSLYGGTSSQCGDDVWPLRRFWYPDKKLMFMPISDRAKLRDYFERHANVAANVTIPKTGYELLIVDSIPTGKSLTLREPAETTMSRNSDELWARLKEIYPSRVAAENIFNLSPLQRAALFGKARCVLVHQGPALANVPFLPNPSTIIEIVPAVGPKDKYELLLGKFNVSVIPIKQNTKRRVDIDFVEQVVRTHCMDV